MTENTRVLETLMVVQAARHRGDLDAVEAADICGELMRLANAADKQAQLVRDVLESNPVSLNRRQLSIIIRLAQREKNQIESVSRSGGDIFGQAKACSLEMRDIIAATIEPLSSEERRKL